MPKKEEQIQNASIGGPAGLTGKTLTAVNAWKHGSVTVIELTHSTGTIFVKVLQGAVEHGGTADWGTGTKLVS